MAYDATTLEEDVKALETRLATPADDQGQSVISKALDLAKDALALVTGTGKSQKALAKARSVAAKAEDADEPDAGDDDTDPDTQAFIDKLLAEGGSGDDADDADDKGTMMKSQLHKALAPDDGHVPEAVEVNGYLRDELRIRERMCTDLATVVTQQGDLAKALGLVLQENTTLKQAVGTLLKGHMALLDYINKFDAAPVELSKFETMVKSLRPVLGPGGGQEVPYNKERAAQMLTKGLLTTAQHKAWKHTNRLPDGVALA